MIPYVWPRRELSCGKRRARKIPVIRALNPVIGKYVMHYYGKVAL
jgi:hypothetical protein